MMHHLIRCHLDCFNGDYTRENEEAMKKLRMQSDAFLAQRMALEEAEGAVEEEEEEEDDDDRKESDSLTTAATGASPAKQKKRPAAKKVRKRKRVRKAYDSDDTDKEDEDEEEDDRDSVALDDEELMMKVESGELEMEGTRTRTGRIIPYTSPTNGFPASITRQSSLQVGRHGSPKW